MKYYLGTLVLGNPPKIELTQHEYNEVKIAWESVRAVANIETDWDNLIENYLELEAALLDSATRSMVTHMRSYDQFQDVISLIARRLFNLLQACNAYKDHTLQHLRSLEPEGMVDRLKKERSRVYDDSFSYRFMEAMRNYAQHCGVPVHGATLGGGWQFDDGGKPRYLRFSAIGRIYVDQIRKDKRFKKSVLDEIDSDVHFLDAIKLTREYLEGLSVAHDMLRSELSGPMSRWKECIYNAIERYSDVNKGNVVGLGANAAAESGRVVETISIFDELLNRIDGLIHKNGSLVKLGRRFVSSELTPLQQR